MPAATIAALLLQYGLPLTIKLIEKWSGEQPTNPEPKEWLELLKNPSLTLTYDQQREAAYKRAFPAMSVNPA